MKGLARGGFMLTMAPAVLLAALIVALALPFLFAGAAHARPDPVYQVARVKLDFKAENAVKAKERAMSEGPLIALRAMFRRIAPFAAYDRLPGLTKKEAEEVVDSFAIRGERNSATRYIAYVDYIFSPRKMRKLMVRKGAPFFDGRAPLFLVMPVLDASLEGKENKEGKEGKEGKKGKARMEQWRRAWSSLDAAHSLSHLRLVKPGLEDLAFWREARGNKAREKALERLRRRHRASRLAVVEAGLNDKGDRMVLRLYGRDNAGPLDYAQEIPFGGDMDKALGELAQIGYGIFEGRWREPHIEGEVMPVSAAAGVESGEGVSGAEGARRLEARLVAETVFMRVLFHGLREWQSARARLERIPGLRDMEINSLSPRGADVRISYPGGARRLTSQLAAYGFELQNQGGDLVLRSLRR
jgi:hypothetical protein